MSHVLDTLRQRVIVADGGMGSMIHQLAEPGFRAPDECNLAQPDVVLRVHVDFLQAGARLIETNTFGANRAKLFRLGLANDVGRINGRAVKLAREAREVVSVDAFIGGSIGPTGGRIEPSREVAAELRDVFREQALALDDRGVDVFVLETFPDAWELARAIEAVRSVSSLPVVAQMTLPAFDEWSDDDELDPSVRRVLDAVAELEADVIGLNCSVGPGQMMPAFRHLAARAHGRLLALQPNSGLPRRVDGRFLYPDAHGAYYAAFARDAVAAGARLVGGCCGTTPEQIAAMAAAIEAQRGAQPPRPAPTVDVRGPAAPAPAAPARATAGPERSGLAAKLAAGQFVVSMQVDPPKGTEAGMVLDAVRAFRDSGHVDCVDVNSNPMARLHMDALWMSAAIEREGVETIAHYTPRDASLMGIQGNLLGAWTQGVRNVLVITGDPSVVSGEPGENDVYQTDAVGMVQLTRELNEGRDCFGNRIGSPPAFTIGVAVNPNAPDLELEVARFRRKIEAGAHFAMTQVFFEWSCWERFLDRLGDCPIPVLAAVWPLTSLRLATRLHHEVPGIVVPDAVLGALDAAGADARKVGFDLAREMLDGARSRTQGVYIIAPFKRPVAALELFTAG